MQNHSYYTTVQGRCQALWPIHSLKCYVNLSGKITRQVTIISISSAANRTRLCQSVFKELYPLNSVHYYVRYCVRFRARRVLYWPLSPIRHNSHTASVRHCQDAQKTSSHTDKAHMAPQDETANRRHPRSPSVPRGAAVLSSPQMSPSYLAKKTSILSCNRANVSRSPYRKTQLSSRSTSSCQVLAARFARIFDVSCSARRGSSRLDIMYPQ